MLRAHLLVGADDEQQVAQLRAPAVAAELHAGGDLRRHLVLHVERPAPPDIVLVEVAAPGIVGPFGGICGDGVDVGDHRQRRPVGLPAQASNEVGPPLDGREQLAIPAGALEVLETVLDPAPQPIPASPDALDRQVGQQQPWLGMPFGVPSDQRAREAPFAVLERLPVPRLLPIQGGRDVRQGGPGRLTVGPIVALRPDPHQRVPADSGDGADHLVGHVPVRPEPAVRAGNL